MPVDIDDELSGGLNGLAQEAPVPAEWPELGTPVIQREPNRPRRHRAVTGLVVAAAVVVIVATVGLVLAHRSGPTETRAAAVPSTTPTRQTLASVAPTAPPTTQPGEATSGAASSTQAAKDLVAAWRNHDRQAAAQVADAFAVKGIFATPDRSMWLRGCTTDDSLDEGGCVFRTATGLVQINTEHRSVGWVVSSATFDPADGGGPPSETGDAPDGAPSTK